MVALGYEVSQSLFVGKNTLLVEGPGDVLFLKALSDALRRRKRTHLDPRWTLCPSGGIDKIQPFVSLFGGNNLNVAVLSDQGASDRKKVEDLKRSSVLKVGQFFTIVDFVQQNEADIEDLFDPVLYASILNGCYALPDPQRLTVDSLHAASPSPRLVKKAEAAFAVMPSTVEEFDHFAPAAWLIRNSQILDDDTDPVNQTLDRAELVFETFNNLLQ